MVVGAVLEKENELRVVEKNGLQSRGGSPGRSWKEGLVNV